MSRALRILFFGCRRMGALTFDGLREAGREIVACYTLDDPSGSSDGLKAACNAAGIQCHSHVPTAGDIAGHRDDRIDLIVSAGYRRRIAAPLLALPRLAALNVAPAPLPQYRGRNPIAWGLFSDEQTWAVTVHAMTGNFHEGPIYRAHPVVIRISDNAYELSCRCATAAGFAVNDAIERILDGADPISQDIRQAHTYTESVPFGGIIDWQQPATRIAAFVRALDVGYQTGNGYRHLAAPARTSISGKDLGIYRAHAGGIMSSYPPGTVTRCDDQLWVQTGRGHLAIESLCTGEADYDAAEFFAGNSIAVGDAFDTAWHWSEQRIITHAA